MLRGRTASISSTTLSPGMQELIRIRRSSAELSDPHLLDRKGQALHTGRGVVPRSRYQSAYATPAPAAKAELKTVTMRIHEPVTPKSAVLRIECKEHIAPGISGSCWMEWPVDPGCASVSPQIFPETVTREMPNVAKTLEFPVDPTILKGLKLHQHPRPGPAAGGLGVPGCAVTDLCPSDELRCATACTDCARRHSAIGILRRVFVDSSEHASYIVHSFLVASEAPNTQNGQAPLLYRMSAYHSLHSPSNFAPLNQGLLCRALVSSPWGSLHSDHDSRCPGCRALAVGHSERGPLLTAWSRRSILRSRLPTTPARRWSGPTG